MGFREEKISGGVFACSSKADKEIAFVYDKKENVTRVLNVGGGVGRVGFNTTERGNSISWQVSSGQVTTLFILSQETMKMTVISKEGVSASNPLGSNKKTSFHICRWVMKQ